MTVISASPGTAQKLVVTSSPDDRTVAGSSPYPWPFHGRLDPAGTALVACLDSRWRVAGAGADEADIRLSRLAGAVRGAGGLVVAVTSMPRRHLPAPAAVPPAAGAGPAGTATPLGGADAVLGCGGASAFFGSDLDGLLRSARRTDLVLAGWGLEGPVHSTMRSANDRGYECLLVADASVPIDPELADAACSMVGFSGGIFGAFADTDNVIAAFGRSPEPRSRT